MKNLCVICARKNSKGLKNKNFKKLNGKPLIFHTISLAVKSKIFNKITVSSDSQKILNFAKRNGANVTLLRPKSLSRDDTPKINAIKHAFKETEKTTNIKFDFITDLDVSSPLRNMQDLKNSFNLFKNKKKYGNLITICDSRKNPFYNMVKLKNNVVSKIFKSNININSRQNAPRSYDMNASIYIWKRKSLLNDKRIVNDKTLAYKMPLTRSIDIDTKEDWKIVECLWKNK